MAKASKISLKGHRGEAPPPGGPRAGTTGTRSDPDRDHHELDPRWLGLLRVHWPEIQWLELHRRKGMRGDVVHYKTYSMPTEVLDEAGVVVNDPTKLEDDMRDAAAFAMGEEIWADVVEYTEANGPSIAWILIAKARDKKGKEREVFRRASLCALGGSGPGSSILDALEAGDPLALHTRFLEQMLKGTGDVQRFAIAMLRHSGEPLQHVGRMTSDALQTMRESQAMFKTAYAYRVEMLMERIEKQTELRRVEAMSEAVTMGFRFLEGTFVDLVHEFTAGRHGEDKLPADLPALSRLLARSVTVHQHTACSEFFDTKGFLAMLGAAARARDEREAAAVWLAHKDEIKKGVPAFMNEGTREQRLLLVKARGRLMVLLQSAEPSEWF